jgi:predicted amidohydrolase
VPDVQLTAVQYRYRPEDYVSPAAFLRCVDSIVARATPNPPTDSLTNTLIAFPEMFALPLLFGLRVPDVLHQDTLPAALRPWLTRYGVQIVRHLGSGIASIVRPTAVDAFQVYVETFSQVAKKYGVMIVAGSGLFPAIDHEPSRGWQAASRQVYNLGHVFSDRGKRLGEVRKQQLTALERRLGITPANTLPSVIHAPWGKLAVTLCLDGFFDGIISHFDGQGAHIVIQPSANFARWDAPWTAGKQYLEGDAWLSFGLRHTIQDREHIRYGVNPMMVGNLWGMVMEGRSSILANSRYHLAACEGYAGVLELAPTAHEDALVSTTVSLP